MILFFKGVIEKKRWSKSKAAKLTLIAFFGIIFLIFSNYELTSISMRGLKISMTKSNVLAKYFGANEKTSTKISNNTEKQSKTYVSAVSKETIQGLKDIKVKQGAIYIKEMPIASDRSTERYYSIDLPPGKNVTFETPSWIDLGYTPEKVFKALTSGVGPKNLPPDDWTPPEWEEKEPTLPWPEIPEIRKHPED